MKKIIASCVLILTGFISNAQSIPAYVSSDNLQGWYPFTGNVLNAFGTGKNGYAVGALLTSDRFGNANSAYHFNGISDHLTIDTTFFNAGWNNYSVSMWFNSDTIVNPYSAGHNQPLINTIPHNGFDIGYNWNLFGKYSLWINGNPGTSMSWSLLYNARTNTPVTAHVWNHMVIVKDSGTVYRIYINGALDTVYRTTSLVTNYYCKMVFGSIDSAITPAEGFLGKLDDYGIWDRSLAPCEIKRLYDTIPYTYLITQPANVASGVADTVSFSVADTGAGNTYQWEENSGSGYTTLSSVSPYSGVTTPTLTITGVAPSMNNNRYRCIVRGAYPCVDSSASGILTISGVGVNTVSVKNISIVPNPTAGQINITGAGKVGVKVYNGIGQLVKTAYSVENMSIAELPVGIYLIKLFDEKGTLIHNYRIVKH